MYQSITYIIRITYFCALICNSFVKGNLDAVKKHIESFQIAISAIAITVTLVHASFYEKSVLLKMALGL